MSTAFWGQLPFQSLHFYNRIKWLLIMCFTVGQHRAEAHGAGREEAGIIDFNNFETKYLGVSVNF
jgi:hypothetical protein